MHAFIYACLTLTYFQLRHTYVCIYTHTQTQTNLYARLLSLSPSGNVSKRLFAHVLRLPTYGLRLSDAYVQELWVYVDPDMCEWTTARECAALLQVCMFVCMYVVYMYACMFICGSGHV